jgi:hypothetical protein
MDVCRENTDVCRENTDVRRKNMDVRWIGFDPLHFLYFYSAPFLNYLMPLSVSIFCVLGRLSSCLPRQVLQGRSRGRRARQACLL